ncbi:MAG: sigma-70 family RNA polymerase sigma factor [Clostridia bacterium]|nr:sigma-70 family RNA polymerase sigma factor [Clostridia bacterium]
MTNAKPMKEMLIEEFTKNYIEKLFYFCLKKTGNTAEAEDLASDVTVHILLALRKGTLPESFSAWVWRVARNRYAAWAKRKHISNETISGADIEEFELASDFSPETSLIEREETELLRRELAFISQSYRDILLAYYVEDRSIKEIAASLSQPEGTVKSNLFRARKILKEGMNMARTFGIKSYKPEDISFASSGNQPSGLPWSAVQRKIPKNILVHASNNPCTLEELSIELGIAMPYMEEEVALLEKATLLKKLDDKYITNFFIVDKEATFAEYAAMRKHSKERSEMLDKIVSDVLPEMRALGIVKNGMSDNDLKWWAIIYASDFCVIQKIKAFDIKFPEKRVNGESWGFVGYEKLENFPESVGMGHNGSGNEANMFWAYKISDYNLWNRAGEMHYHETLLLADIVRNNRNISSLTDSEQAIWKGIDGRFAHTDENGNIIPDIIITDNAAFEKIHSLIESHPLYSQVMANAEEAFDACVEALRARSHPAIANQLTYCASMEILGIRMLTVHDEVEAGRLTPPENPKKSTIAMWLHLK